MRTETLPQAIERLGLSIRAEFVPFSQSRNAKAEPRPGERSLNWRVALVRDGRDILTTDYSAGIGHCPSYTRIRMTAAQAAAIEHETETGRQARAFPSGGFMSGKPILPSAVDVVYSLVSDSDVLDCSTFEEWAKNLGYDTDSRRAEATYRACLEIALKLRNGLGETALAELREAAADY